jgi:Zn-dependent protease with chaperone function
MAASSEQEWTPRIEPNARPMRYRSTWKWLEVGAERQSTGVITAVIAGWTGVPLALWLAAVGVVGGAFAGIVGASNIGLAHTLHVDEGVGVFAAIAGAFIGALAGFLLIFVSYVEHPAQFLGAIVSGLVIGSIGLAVIAFAEPRLMQLRGYRPLSRREKEKLHPLLLDAGYRMSLGVVPELWMSDSMKPQAWAHMRAIVVTKGLLDYDSSEKPPHSPLGANGLSAILAHELHHWEFGDVVGNCMVWACFWPVVIVFNALCWLQEKGKGIGILGWIFFWPAWVTTKLIVVPLMAKRSRHMEYLADWRAASLGEDYRIGLRHALDELSVWEQPRSGWEEALAATHPPIELRLEKLEWAPPEPEPSPAPALARSVAQPPASAPVAEATPVDPVDAPSEPASPRARQSQPQPTTAPQPRPADQPQPSVAAEANQLAEPSAPRGKLTRPPATAEAPTPPSPDGRAAPQTSAAAGPARAKPAQAPSPAKPEPAGRGRTSKQAPADDTTDADVDERWLPSKRSDDTTPRGSTRRQRQPPQPPDG